MEKDSTLSNLYTESGIQDSLLQSYRSYILTIQSILIALGTGLSIAVISEDQKLQCVLILIIFLTSLILALYILFKLRKVILSRELDVDYWHMRIIEYEKELTANQKYFTRFKIYQKFHRKNIDETEFKTIEVSEEGIDQLVTKSKGHTRNVIDNQILIAFAVAWGILLTVVILKLVLILM